MEKTVRRRFVKQYQESVFRNGRIVRAYRFENDKGYQLFNKWPKWATILEYEHRDKEDQFHPRALIAWGPCGQ